MGDLAGPQICGQKAAAAKEKPLTDCSAETRHRTGFSKTANNASFYSAATTERRWSDVEWDLEAVDVVVARACIRKSPGAQPRLKRRTLHSAFTTT